jgi:mannose-6-phosphate isomerase-like protein (cupin superfamily)
MSATTRTRAKVLKPFRDGRPIWKGLERDGSRRKLFHLLDVDLHDTKHLVAGLAMFEPGEGAAFHSHPESEEVNIAIKGRGTMVCDGEELPFDTYDFMYIPAGTVHCHFNTGDEPLWLVYIYGPPGQLPSV